MERFRDLAKCPVTQCDGERARLRESMRQPVLVDGRNVYDPKEMRDYGFKYGGVGRA